MGFFPLNHKFPTGELLISPKIIEVDFDYQPFLRRHLCGDWGDLCPDDVKANETALLEHEAILSQYDAIIKGAKETVVIMTESDRSERLYSSSGNQQRAATPHHHDLRGGMRALSLPHLLSPFPQCQTHPAEPHQHQPMKQNYSIRRCTSAMARIAIESHQDLDPTTKPEIWRFSPSGWSLISTLDEAVIGRSEGKTCAFVCRVRQNDVIGTREVFSSGEAVWSYYRIDTSFRPELLAGDARHPSWLNLDVLRPVNQTSPLPDDSDELEIRRFFSQKHPEWLQQIVDRQIAQWRESKPDRFFRFAPTALSERGLGRCVKEAPFAALARFKGLLDESQIRECVIRSPRGAVIYALEYVTDRLRMRYLIEHVSEALLHSHNKLSDKELAECAWIDMETGFHMRDRLLPHRRAIALAKSYPFNFLKTGTDMEDVHREISESIFAFPDQWEASEHGGFPAVFEYLENRIGWSFDPVLFADLLKQDGSRTPGAFERFLAGMI